MILGILNVIGFISQLITGLEVWLAYKGGVQHQVLADKAADISKLQAEAVARANAGSASDALKRHDF
jgi:hypothetical protein